MEEKVAEAIISIAKTLKELLKELKALVGAETEEVTNDGNV